MDDVLGGVGPRLRSIRQARELTLGDVAEATGISTSTLSRLESGGRKPTLEFLLALSTLYDLPLDDLVGAPAVGDPRVHPRPVRRNGMVVVPLTHFPGPQQALKMVIPSTRSTPAPCRHEGHEWLYVLSGELRLIVGNHDVVLTAGQAAEFDTTTPHWFGSTGTAPVEVLSLLGLQGQRIHLAGPAQAGSRAATHDSPDDPS
ncbi:helix-turn-helix domain-containing protein [Pseudoclavibacter albus]|uniref:helix-turn-helix domain-containing protein n=1 Tax=Pseudoclavibacter albus TaxID=272241 RepID=UPI000826F655|nr:cupin domain-containing protein [Pseudoclavibacter alba]